MKTQIYSIIKKVKSCHVDIIIVSMLIVSIIGIILCLYQFSQIIREQSSICPLWGKELLTDNYPLKSGGIRADILEKCDIHYEFHSTRLLAISLIITFISAILTFIAFIVQFLYNRTQKKDLSQERFENQYFKLLDIYRTICLSASIEHVGSGKRAFHYMFYEYKAIYNLIKKKCVDASTDDINALSFKLFLDGVSPSFSHDAANSIMDEEKLSDLVQDLLRWQKESETHNPDDELERGVRYLADYRGKNIKLFDGHRPRLIPYFNYVSLILTHIKNNQNKEIEMLKYFVSELTEHEVGLIYAYACYRSMQNGSINEKYIEETFPNLNKIYTLLKSDSEDKFKYDSETFIKPDTAAIS